MECASLLLLSRGDGEARRPLEISGGTCRRCRRPRRHGETAAAAGVTPFLALHDALMVGQTYEMGKICNRGLVWKIRFKYHDMFH